MNTLLAIGYGYSARRLRRRLEPKGWRVIGTGRSGRACEAIGKDGVEAVCFDGTVASRALAAALETATHVVVSVPPGAVGDPVLALHAVDFMRARQLQWVGYLSTVGVYGDHAGGWVDETTPVNPGSQRSRWRAAAESEWMRLGQSSGIRVELFRLAGIYGPGRSAFDALRSGTARRIVKAGQVFNRIHVDDIAGILEAAMARPTDLGVYNVSDEEPAPPQDVIAHAADFLGIPAPPAVPFEAAQLTAMARSFYDECKRVSSQRTRAALGVTLTCPSYREGLAAILADERCAIDG